MEQKEKTIRARNFSFLIYPDSAPAEWFNFLNDTHVPGCVSPLHDKDVFILPSSEHKAGDLKKPHKHVLLSFNGNKTCKQILEILEPLGVSHVEIVHNISAMVRYFAHMDNPEKAQYNPADIIGFCGFDVNKYLFSGGSLYKEVADMIKYISENNVKCYADFFDYCLNEKNSVWIPILLEHGNINNTVRYYIQNYRKIDKKTGKDLAKAVDIF